MRQLTSLDAQFLALENPRQSGHVAGLAILDPSTAQGGRIGCREITELLRERLPLLPPLRWRLAEVTLGLDYPYWVDDRDFDLGYHVRELALATPGGDGQLAVPRYPVRMLRALPSALPNLEHTPFGVLPGAGTVTRLAGVLSRDGAERTDLVAPRTRFSGRITPHRRFVFGRLSLADVKAAK